MRFRYRSIRARTFFLVLTPLVSLMALYVYASLAAASNAIALARSTAVRDSIADPTGLFIAQVQQERLAAAVFLALPTQRSAAALSAQDNQTTAAFSTVRSRVATITPDEDPAVRSAISAMLQKAGGLPALRARVSSKSVSRTAAEQDYTAVIVAGYRAIEASFLQMPDVQLVTQSSAVLRIAEAEDALLQAQALVTADSAAGSFPAADRAQFAMLTGEYQGLLAEALPDLDPAYRASFEQTAHSRQAAELSELNAQVINGPRGKTGVSAVVYGRAAQGVALGLALAGFSVGQRLADALHASAGPINQRLYVTAGVGLAAIIASIGLSIWIGRGIVNGLAALRREALELARKRLPQVMARLTSGEDVAVETAAPPMPVDDDEIGQVRQAFNTVQRAAIEAGAEQSRLRSGVTIIFRNLALRSQSLVHQQLSLLDTLERSAEKPEELERLFQLDHLATRMRRNAEGLLVLAGDHPSRTWTDPVPMVDVIRGSVAEVVDYARIRVACSSRAAVQGYAAADLIHLIAELAENAAAYSPPDYPVRVSGSEVVKGFAVEIEDRGFGIPASMAAHLNAVLADPPPFNPAQSEQLGLYVAARLAQRHSIGITLRDSPYGGTTAIVFVPASLITSEEPGGGQVPGAVPAAPAARQLASAAGRVPATDQAGRDASRLASLTGRHASRDGVRAAGMTGKHVSRDPEVREAGGTGLPAGPQFQLPKRVRQANLPPHLRGRPPQVGPPAGVAARLRPPGEASEEEIRAAFADIQRGMDRGNREALVPGRREEHRDSHSDPRGAGRPPWKGPASVRSTGDK